MKKTDTKDIKVGAIKRLDDLHVELIHTEGEEMRVTSVITNSRGQAIVELALSLLLLFLLLLGIFEFGRAMYIKNTLTHAARAGARAAIVTPGIINETGATCSTGGANAIIYQTVCSNLYAGIKQSEVQINVAIAELVAPSGLNTGDMVEVRVSWPMDWVLIPRFQGDLSTTTLTLVGTTAMRYE